MSEKNETTSSIFDMASLCLEEQEKRIIKGKHNSCTILQPKYLFRNKMSDISPEYCH